MGQAHGVFKWSDLILTLQDLAELPHYLVILNPEELEAFKIEPDTLKHMRSVPASTD
jgi:hypothetical protein